MEKARKTAEQERQAAEKVRKNTKKERIQALQMILATELKRQDEKARIAAEEKNTS